MKKGEGERRESGENKEQRPEAVGSSQISTFSALLINGMGGGLTIIGNKWLSDGSLLVILFVLGGGVVCFSRFSKKLFRDTTKCFDWVIESQAKHFLL